ncbi:hypothetical protein ABBQ38_012499 [Trebouxia sp. C0009 RCD-2024]
MMTNLRSNRNKAHLGLGALLIALCLVSWLVLLAGIAAVQKRVKDIGGQGSDSSHAVEFEWWILFFEAFVLFLAATGHFLGFRASHAAVVALLSVVTALSMLWCHNWNQIRRGNHDKRSDTVFAGFLLVSIFNSLLILVLGTIPDESDGVYRKGTNVSTAGPNRGVATPAAGATVI